MTQAIAPSTAGGSEWARIRARLTGEKHVETAEDRRQELADLAREENEAFEGAGGRG